MLALEYLNESAAVVAKIVLEMREGTAARIVGSQRVPVIARINPATTNLGIANDSRSYSHRHRYTFDELRSGQRARGDYTANAGGI